MPFVMLIAALVAGLIAVGFLLLLEAVMSAFRPGWMLPFSAWWGLLLSLPAMVSVLLSAGRGMGRRLGRRRMPPARDELAGRPPAE